MDTPHTAEKICQEINKPAIKLGDLRAIAKEIKKNHELALALWNVGSFFPRLLAILIMDAKKLDAEAVDRLFTDVQKHPSDEQLQLADWFMANQLTKNKRLIALMHSWQHHASALHRRMFWYYQGRLRWMGQVPPSNTEELLLAVEEKMMQEAPEVQWAMNFTTAWIGIFDVRYRDRCIHIGEKLGLYKDEITAKNCTPNYLPKFIEQEVKKRKL